MSLYVVDHGDGLNERGCIRDGLCCGRPVGACEFGTIILSLCSVVSFSGQTVSSAPDFGSSTSATDSESLATRAVSMSCCYGHPWLVQVASGRRRHDERVGGMMKVGTVTKIEDIVKAKWMNWGCLMTGKERRVRSVG